MPWMEIRVHDAAGSLQATGRARSGRVESAAGSIVQRAAIRLLDQWNGSVELGNILTVTIFSVGADGKRFIYDAFKGKITRVRPDGDYILVEAASPAAALLVKSAKLQAWSNVVSTKVLSDLLSQAGLKASFPSSISNHLLHVWNTEGGLLAHELTSLLYANHPGIQVFSDYTGDLLLGARADLAKQFTLFPFPADSTQREVASDIEQVKFTLRPAFAHQAVYDPFTRACLGTIEFAAHSVDPVRGAWTTVILDRTSDSAVEGYVSSDAPDAVVAS